MDLTLIIVALSITSFLAMFFGFYAIKFGIILLRVQDQIEESLDILDTQYGKVSEVLKMPAYSDSQEVREVVGSVFEARDSILSVSNILVRHSSSEENLQIEED